MSEDVKARRNVSLPGDLYDAVKALGDDTHRTIVGTIEWLLSEQQKRGVDPTPSEPVSQSAA